MDFNIETKLYEYNTNKFFFNNINCIAVKIYMYMFNIVGFFFFFPTQINYSIQTQFRGLEGHFDFGPSTQIYNSLISSGNI